MTTHVSGHAAILAAAQPLVPYRRAIMDLLVGHPLITTAEYDTAMQRTQACACILTLQRWYRNTVRELADREESAGMVNGQPVAYATTAQKQEITRLGNSHYILRREKTAAQLKLPRLDYAGAVALIGELWAKILRRQERAAEGMESASDSFSNAS